MCDQKQPFAGGYVEYPKQELPYGWSWPEGIPSSYDELVRDWGEYVAKAVTRYNKVDRNLVDLLQEVWAKLIGSQLLEKFVEGAARRLPASMTVPEACDFLGIGLKQWQNALRAKPWMLKPLEGRRTSVHAIFDTREVIDIGDGAINIWRARTVRIRPPITARGFKSYLTQTIHNHFANWCRTRSRKYKEQLLTPTSALVRQTDGCCRQVAHLEDLTGGWESNIAAAMTIDEEDMLDLMGVIRRARVDLNTSEGEAVLDFLIQQGSSCEDGPQRNIEVLGLLGRGYTLHEAAKRVQQRVRARVRVATLA